MLSPEQLSEKIKEKAREIGFTECGIAEAKPLVEESVKLSNWLQKGYNAEMHYMNNHFDKRINPKKLVEGSKSVISVLLNYYPKEVYQSEDKLKISKYAYGLDYHYVIKDKLKELVTYINQLVGSFNSRVFVDSAPVMDKAWAQRSGLGWIGKNNCLIVKKKGSYFFIGEIICDLELAYDQPENNEYCGNCTACIDACPTSALSSAYELDARKCISFLTIENKSEIPQEFKGNFKNWIFGCDICQDVCPHNKFSIATKVAEFHPKISLSEMNKEDWLSLDKATFKTLFKNSCLERTKFEGLKRNIQFVTD